ncbi:ExbD/TolR family protein [Marinifilum caeruleilacunae]|uniref:Biopolymer transporter ExbD n=1 Tax=Marinifilum caeruleilacunae TaxID=2499076 RepID=A0ABX1WZU9_9BACT|nr:biopolymer transporter ExbD [Marinifilum caeruleilacunae]NOU61661.1 biopolymer transporter ExbD [Marinifilum caeruleilacunae]
MARKTPEINSSSMADIAFLLLIFFLVSTTMDVDTGIYKKLPPIPEKDQVEDDVKVKKRNVLAILVNRNDELLVNGELLDISQLREKTKEFILNPNNDENLPEKQIKTVPYFGDVPVSKGLVSLQNDRGTSYEMYIRVQDELAIAARELKDEKAMQKWSKKYSELDDDQQDAVKKYVPMAISEAEPKNVGGKR